MPGLIAIVGRPNVGKSTLFNRIVGRRIAIVHDRPGVTRDRISAEAEWRGRPFSLVDTGGIGLLRAEKTDDELTGAALAQVDMAVASADAIVLVTDAQEGVMPLDREVAERLRTSGKPILVAANKVDTARLESASDEFTALGFPEVFPVSAIHDRGLAALMQAALAFLPKPESAHTPPSDIEDKQPEGSALKLAIIGRPNVGKSSLINTLTQSARVIVSAVPGTTRDAVDVPFEVETEGVRQRYVLIDTAGIRKERRIRDSIEFFSVRRADKSIARADIVVLVLDAESGVLEQDKKIADKILEQNKACILVVNKWDLFKEAVEEAQEKAKRRQRKRGADGGRRPDQLHEFGRWVQRHLFFLDYAPVIFTSAKSGFHLDQLLEAVRYVAAQLRQKIPTALVNRAIQEAVERKQPVSAQGHRLKFFYATQVRQSPPTFLLFVNRDELFSEPYKRYLADRMRQAFGYEGCPIVLVPKPRPRKVEPIRRHTQAKAKARGRKGMARGAKRTRH